MTEIPPTQQTPGPSHQAAALATRVVGEGLMADRRSRDRERPGKSGAAR